MKKSDLMKKRVMPGLAALAMGLTVDASAALVNTGAHTYTGNVNGVGASARYAASPGFAAVGLGADGYGLQYHHWLDGWEAGDTFSVRGDDVAMYDPKRYLNGDASFYGVGYAGICLGGYCLGDDYTSFGLNHHSQHILFTLTGVNQDLTFTLSGDSSLAPAVTGKHGPNVNSGNLGTNAQVAWVLYSGRSTVGVNDANHAYEHGPGSTHWSNISWMESDMNDANAMTVSKTLTNLAAGDYTLYIGVNASSPAIPGGGGKNFYFEASSVASPVPVPAAAWLFGSALMGLATIGRRTSVHRKA